jgi:hypothetical protein
VPLRPFGIGDMLTGAVGYIRENPLLTLGAAAIVMLVSELVQLVVDLALPQSDPADLAAGQIGGLAAQSAGQLVSALIGIALSALLTGLLLVVLSRAVLGQRIDPGAAWQAMAPRAPGLVGLSLLIGLIVGAIMLVGFLPALVAGATGSGGAIALAVILIMAAVLATVYLTVLWALAPAAYVLEPIGVGAALRRSSQLVRGAWWRTFGILALTGLLVGVPAIAVIGVLGGFSLEPATTGSMILSSIGIIVATTFAVPFATGVTGLLYVDQRIRRERFDVDLMRSSGG